MLFVQGSRDKFGTPQELKTAIGSITPRPTIYIIEGGDHSLKLSRRDPQVQTAVLDDAQRTVVEWIESVVRR